MTVAYVYDALNRLTEANYSDGRFNHYTYDKVGNRLTASDQYSTTTYTYDEANRLVSVDGPSTGSGQAVAYTYDANGNLLSDGVNTYTYDSANHLSSVSNQSSVTSYQYRCNGLSRDAWGITGCNSDRVSQTTNGVTTYYTLDQAAGLTQILDDGANTYLYGAGRIAQVNATGTEYFLGDALGSVRQMTDASGAVTLAKAYDPYGQAVQSSGTGSSRYGFTGEQYDESTGMVYLRARYYAPSVGRFLSRDSWGGDANNPLSFNRWAYTEGNPINLIDPSGFASGRPLIDDGCSYLFPGSNASYVESHVNLSKSDWLNTYTVAGLAVQCWEVGTWDYWPWSKSRGPAQVSEKQVSTPYGDGTGLRCYILRFNPEVTQCFTEDQIEKCTDISKVFELEPPLDPSSWHDAAILMRRRIQHAIDTCTDCKATDKYIIAAMAQNGPGFTGIFKGKNSSAKKLDKKDQTDDYIYDWKGYYSYADRIDTIDQLWRFREAINAFIARDWSVPDLDDNYISDLINTH